MACRIGVFDNGWWREAATIAGHEPLLLPVAGHSSGNAYCADAAGRIANGQRLASLHRASHTEFWLDNGGTGLAFLRSDRSGGGDVRLAHEAVGKVLVSHFIDPLTTPFQGLDWRTVWQSLRSRMWVKAVWDRAQALELARFGVPNVVHLPMAAPNRDYDTEPLDPTQCRPVVSFVGGQNTSYFRSSAAVPGSSLLAGTIAQAHRASAPNALFCDTYFDVFDLAEPITPADDPASGARKTHSYFAAKLYYHASLCLRNRDRYVIFLKRRIPGIFELIGRGWDVAYGLECAAPFPSMDDYFAHFRRTAINLNLVNGNAETGLNMRHFEITAAGGFMLCADQPELAECFVPGRECAVFNSEADLLGKIEHYMARPDERSAIAAAGQRRTLRDHLYCHRVARVVEILRGGGAIPRPADARDDDAVVGARTGLAQGSTLHGVQA